MKIELNAEIPVEYEATGEFRQVKICEFYLGDDGKAWMRDLGMSNNPRIILRKVAPKMRAMTMRERIYILSTPHCVVRSSETQNDNWYPNYDLRTLNVDDWEYGFVREDGSIDGPHKFEKEV